MAIVDGIIKKGYVVDVLPDTSPWNNILKVVHWLNKLDKCENGSNTMSVKLDVYLFIYHNKTLEAVTMVDILSRIYSEPQTKWNFYDNPINKSTKEKMLVKIIPKL